MPSLTQQSADVRFREIDLSQTIRSRSSSNGAILFVSRKGRPGRYKVNDSQAFIAEYGIPDASLSFGHYCALDALKEMNSLECVRVLGAGYRWSGLIMKDNGLGVTSLAGIPGGVPDVDNPDWDSYVAGAEVPLLLFTPKSGPGSYGNNLAIQIASQNLSTPAAPSLSSVNTGGSLVNGTYEYRISAISEIGETLASSVATIVVGGPTTTATVTLTWTLVPGARGYYIYGRVNGNMFRLAVVGATTSTWVDTGTAVPDTDYPPITNPALLPPPTKEFTIRVFDLEQSTSVPVEEWPSTLTDFTDGNGRQLEPTQQINALSDYINVASYVPQLVVPVPAVISTSRVSLTGGDSGTAPTNGQIALAWESEFGDPEQSQVNILINAGYTDVSVQQAMLRVAERRGDAFAILDTPQLMQRAQDAITYRQLILNANTSYGAIYTSDVFEDDPYNGKKLYVPPSGWVAAVFARTDRVAGPQFQPAGLNRGLIDALALRYEYNEQQRTDLFNAQVNYVRRFLGEGTSVFEATTLQAKQSALSWVSVRRMVNVIKGAVKDFLIYSLHEPNDDFTRRQIVTSISDYLQYWKDARGILDYQVISDETNNPVSKYNLGILTVTIFITPVIPVHEIQVDIVITKAGVSFSEINIANLG